MKFAPFHTLLLCLLFCAISCKESAKEVNDPNRNQNTTIDSLPYNDIKKDRDLKSKPGSKKPTKEQLDRAIDKKKKTSILDSLKPKTA
ncbi:hypothetical protein [uncultured Eudoraea sp.]|uniref:hypothetical protein n=1 Tax=uncultured Eudoraea sp. TaxID=1035614 RepID=UPI002602E21F|nr:hypothetical protein [uncultured Eudoraea sp.]